jgi:hypothetical protein
VVRIVTHTTSPQRQRPYNKHFPARYVCWRIAIRVYQSCPHSRFTAAMAAEMFSTDEPFSASTGMGQKLMSMEGAGMVRRVERQNGKGTFTWWEFTPAFRAYMQENGREYGCA